MVAAMTNTWNHVFEIPNIWFIETRKTLWFIGIVLEWFGEKASNLIDFWVLAVCDVISFRLSIDKFTYQKEISSNTSFSISFWAYFLISPSLVMNLKSYLPVDCPRRGSSNDGRKWRLTKNYWQNRYIFSYYHIFSTKKCLGI